MKAPCTITIYWHETKDGWIYSGFKCHNIATELETRFGEALMLKLPQIIKEAALAVNGNEGVETVPLKIVERKLRNENHGKKR